MKIEARMGTKIEYLNKKGEKCIGIVTCCNLANQDWIYQIDDKDIYIDWNENDQVYCQVD